MNSEQLRYFLAVAEHLNFRQAAESLHITQPPLTRQIQKLETQLGVSLFSRSKRRVEMTPAGRELQQGAAELMLRLGELETRTRRAAAGRLGKLSIGFVTTANFSVLPELVRGFREGHAAIDIQLLEATGDEQVQGITAGALDIGIMFSDFPPQLRAMPLHRERYVAVLPRSHPLVPVSGTGTLACSDLSQEDFVFVPRSLAPGLFDAVMAYTESNGFRPRISQAARQMQTVIGLVAAGMGVSIVPQCMSMNTRPDVCYLPLTPQPPWLTTYAVWSPQNPSAVLPRFVQELRVASR